MDSRAEKRLAAVQDPRIAAALAALFVGCCAIALWLWDGVSADEMARFLAYEVGFVILPGCLLYSIATPLTSGFRMLVMGWGIGHVLEVLAFVAAAALGVRELFSVYPVVVFVITGGVWLRRRRRQAPASREAASPWAQRRIPRQILGPWAWANAVVCVLVLGFLFFSYFVWTPLPREIDRVLYTTDYVLHVSLAAEALNHWPIENPNVSGTSLDYYWFVHAHFAAVSQVTGIDLPVVVLALDIVPVALLMVLQLSLAGAMFGRRWTIGPLAALTALFVSEIDVTRSGVADSPFSGALPSYLVQSPTFIFGAVMFIPLVLLLAERLVASRQSFGQWALIALLAVGCAGTKGPALPVAAGGLVLYMAWRWLTSRQVERAALIGLGLLVPIMCVFLVVLYGDAGGRLVLQLPGAIGQNEWVRIAVGGIDQTLVRTAFWAAVVPVSLVLMLVAPLVGVGWLLQRYGRDLPPEQALPLAMLLASMAPMLLVQEDGISQQFFFMYGLLAAVPVAATGLYLFFQRWHAAPGSSQRRAIAFAGLWTLILGLIVFGVGNGLDDLDLLERYAAWYLAPLIAMVALAVFAIRSPARLRQQRAMYAVLAVLITAGVNGPLDFVPSVLDLADDGDPVYLQSGYGLKAEIRDDLYWLRENTTEDDVLAVSNYGSPVAKAALPLYFYVAALAQRRTFLQGWAFTSKGNEDGFDEVVYGGVQPYPQRWRLLRAAFERASPRALARLAGNYDVTHLVVDKKEGYVSPLLRDRARLVHSGDGLDVYSLAGVPANSK